MNRRSFLKLVAALPFVGAVVAKAKPVAAFEVIDAKCRYPLRDVPCQYDLVDESERIEVGDCYTISDDIPNVVNVVRFRGFESVPREVVTYRSGKWVRG